MKAVEFIFTRLDYWAYRFLMSNRSSMPVRWKKFLAMYFPDARVRKHYWESLNVFMGDGTYANPGFTVVNNMSEACRIEIGNNVSIAPNVIIVTDSAPNNSRLICRIPYVRDKLIQQRPVRIEDEVWLGAGVIVLPGVVVGKGAIIGAGSVVIGDIPPFTVAAGTPAKVTRKLEIPPES